MRRKEEAHNGAHADLLGDEVPVAPAGTPSEAVRGTGSQRQAAKHGVSRTGGREGLRGLYDLGEGRESGAGTERSAADVHSAAGRGDRPGYKPEPVPTVAEDITAASAHP